jgi:hypothetical protein
MGSSDMPIVGMSLQLALNLHRRILRFRNTVSNTIPSPLTAIPRPPDSPRRCTTLSLQAQKSIP